MGPLSEEQNALLTPEPFLQPQQISNTHPMSQLYAYEFLIT